MRIAHGRLLTDDNTRIGRNDCINGKTEKCLTVTVVELADKLDSVRLMVVVLYLGLNENAVTGRIIPNMDAKRRYASLGCTDERQGSEYAKRLTALTET